MACETPSGGLVIAAEEALDSLSTAASNGACGPQLEAALSALQHAVSRSAAALVLARQRNAASLVQRWLRNDALCEAAASCIAALASSDTHLERCYLNLLVKDGDASTGLGWRVWRGALTLCSLLTPALVGGRSVLELGAGAGLCGMHAARLGAAIVVLTDVDEALPPLIENVARNGLEHSVSVRSLDWATPSVQGLACADLILGSDVCYAEEHAALLPALAVKLLAQDGLILLVNGIRFPLVLSLLVLNLAKLQLIVCTATLPAKNEGDDDGADADSSVTLSIPPLGQMVIAAWRRAEKEPKLPDLPWCRVPDGALRVRIFSFASFFAAMLMSGVFSQYASHFLSRAGSQEALQVEQTKKSSCSQSNRMLPLTTPHQMCSPAAARARASSPALPCACDSPPSDRAAALPCRPSPLEAAEPARAAAAAAYTPSGPDPSNWEAEVSMPDPPSRDTASGARQVGINRRGNGATKLSLPAGASPRTDGPGGHPPAAGDGDGSVELCAQLSRALVQLHLDAAVGVDGGQLRPHGALAQQRHLGKIRSGRWGRI